MVRSSSSRRQEREPYGQTTRTCRRTPGVRAAVLDQAGPQAHFVAEIESRRPQARRDKRDGAMSSELSPAEIWQSEHTSDQRIIQDFEQTHPDAISNLRLEREPRFQFRVLRWGEEGERAFAELRGLLAYPNDLTSEPARHPPALLREILEEIRLLLTGPERGSSLRFGPGWDAIAVTLAAHREDLAATLLGRYGDAVVLTVGQFPYPMGRPLTSIESMIESHRKSAPRVPPPEPFDIPGLESSLRLASPRVKTGSRFEATLALTNVSPDPIEVSHGAAIVKLLDPESEEVVGGFQGAIRAIAYSTTIESGETQELGCLTGTGSFRPDLGYSLPAGRYLARADLALTPRHPPGPPSFLRTAPTEITLMD